MKRIDTTGYREEEGTRDESRIAQEQIIKVISRGKNIYSFSQRTEKQQSHVSRFVFMTMPLKFFLESAGFSKLEHSSYVEHNHTLSFTSYYACSLNTTTELSSDRNLMVHKAASICYLVLYRKSSWICALLREGEIWMARKQIPASGMALHEE